MVSRLGTEALAAILPAGLVSFLPSGFAIGAMASLNTFVSQSLGRGDKKNCSNYFWQAIYMGLAYFLAVVAIMWPAAPWIFEMMGQPPPVAEMEVIYFRIMLYAHVLAVINWAGSQFFMGIHRPIITMCASLCGQVVNIAANYVLIFGRFGFPELGIRGAGWGTFIGIAVAAVINMAVFLSSTMNMAFKTRRTANIDFSKMYDLLKVGLPAGFGLMVNVAFWGMILFGLVGRFGTEALAATSAALSYTSISVMPVIKVGVNILICAAVYQVFHAARIIYGGALRGAGDTVWLAIVSAVGAALILGLGGLLLLSLGYIGPWIAATFSIIVVGLANRWRFKSNRWMNIDLFKRRAVGVPAEVETAAE
jgi:MATE family multidrug resistance protein